MSVGEKLVTIANNLRNVYGTGYITGQSAGFELGYNQGCNTGYSQGYETGINTGHRLGRQEEYDRFWDAYQETGDRKDYSYAFCGTGWTDDTFHPKYDLRTGSVTQMFRGAKVTDLRKALQTQGISLDTGDTAYFTQFCQLSSVTVVPALDMRNAANTNQAFGYTPVEVIEKLTVSEKTPWINTFISCSKLTEIRFEGEIGTEGLSFSSSKKLSYESIMSVVCCLKDYSQDTATHTVTLGSDNLIKLTDEEKAMATEKGWTLV